MNDQPNLLTAAEIAEAIGYNVRTIRQWTCYGLPCIHLPTKTLNGIPPVRYILSDVQDWLHNRGRKWQRND